MTMTNNQAALLAACTANAGHPQFDTAMAIKATKGFKAILDAMDKEDATTQAEARESALPAHCRRHMREQYTDVWQRDAPQIRRTKPGEICQTPGCHHLEPATTNEEDQNQ
ncbi:hypothetical protein SEA_COLUCCI_53 [Arthrobacter phage Colucci]|uniref:Uncharacterized protein n=1 Tax=Arthrobacter phage Colucci TaxID=2015834 RepID=A0A286N2W6_9CAUD|nr:hypothetical protein FDI27_gp053 [Arthrobacter phage Colucci]ASX98723.1 hypothetical protein SEA_COLUCCI_53 [Arthrobacter phage Colucci]